MAADEEAEEKAGTEPAASTAFTSRVPLRLKDLIAKSWSAETFGKFRRGQELGQGRHADMNP